MVRRSLLSILSLFLVFITMGMSFNAVSGQQEARKYAEYLIQAKQAEKAGDHNITAENYERAFRLIDQLGYTAEETADEKIAVLTWLAGSYDKVRRYEDALLTYQQAMVIVDRLDSTPRKSVSFALSGLAAHQHRLGRYEDALRTYERLLPLDKKLFGPTHTITVAVMHDMATIHSVLGNTREAENLYRQAIDILEQSPGQDTKLLLTLMNNLGILYYTTDREALGRQLHKRASEIRGGTQQTNARPPNKPSGELQSETNYSLVEKGQEQKIISQEQSYKGRIEAATHGGKPDDLANALSGLANYYMQSHRDRESGELYRQALDIQENFHGLSHPLVANTLVSIGILCVETGRYAEAENYLRRSLTIYSEAFGDTSPHSIEALVLLSRVYKNQGKLEGAIDVMRNALRIVRAHYLTDPNDIQNYDESGKRLFGRMDVVRVFSVYEQVRLFHQLLHSSPQYIEKSTAESFEAHQILTTGMTAGALGQMAARFASGNDELASLIRRYQDLTSEKQRLNKTLIGSIGSSKRSSDTVRIAAVRQDMAKLNDQLASLERELNERFPEYVELSNPRPLELVDAQSLLGPEEALVSYLLGSKESWLWVVRGDKAAFLRMDIGKKEISDRVQELRKYLDPERYMRPFPVNAAHELYKLVFAPAEPYLLGASHIMVVPDGALQSLPFSVLVTDAPAKSTMGFNDYPQVSWLAKRYAITTLPSVSSLRALRRFAKVIPAPQPFTGFGNPTLEGDPAEKRGVSLTRLFSRGAIANTDEVRRLPPLPDTEKELINLAQVLHAPRGQVFLRETATESRVKKSDLSKSRVIAFSTHGLVAGDIKGLAEPALVLTPPERGSEQDDGLLTASEVAKLKLNADWVILSACNTAAPDGTPGADGLSGLARAFMYAGSRSLLVSHWPVVSDATVLLTTRMLKESAKGVGRSEALRRSMLSLMEGRDNAIFTHPMAWAPFVVVGEGAR